MPPSEPVRPLSDAELIASYERIAADAEMRLAIRRIAQARADQLRARFAERAERREVCHAAD